MRTGHYVLGKQNGVVIDVEVFKCDKCGTIQYQGDNDCKNFVQLDVIDLCNFELYHRRKTPYDGNSKHLCGNCMIEFEAWLG